MTPEPTTWDFDGQAERYDRILAGDSPMYDRYDDVLAAVAEAASVSPGGRVLDIGTGTGNLAALPGLSVPCGFTSGGLPVGMQLMGRAWDEARLLRAAHAFQQATDWHTRRPAL